MLQEQVLASRVLHFSPREVLWECGGIRRCESYPTALPPQLLIVSNRNTHPKLKKASCLSKNKALSTNDIEAVRSSWYDIFKRYSHCHLTKTSDSLIAISGVARMIKPLLKDQYLAGLWVSTLGPEMFWYGYPTIEDLRPKPTQYRAPSFS